MDLFTIQDEDLNQTGKEFLDTCINELRVLDAKNKEDWDSGDRALERLSLDNNTLTIHYGDNRIVVADARIIGTYSPAHNDFLWAHANPDFSEKSVATAHEVSAWAAVHGFAGLGKPSLSNVPLNAAWDILAIATKLTSAEAATIIQLNDSVYGCLVLKNIQRLH